MKFESLVASRLALGDKSSFSRFIIQIAVIAIALSVAVMITATCMMSGFSKEIKERIFGFWGEIHITNFENNDSYESSPIKKESVLVDKIKQSKEVKNIAPFIIKAGILKSKTEINGIALKGVDTTYDWKMIQSFIVQGAVLKFEDSVVSKDILISKATAKELKLKVGDKVLAYFIRRDASAPIGRKLQVSGIFETGLEEYDKQYAIVDIQLLRQLNQWQANEVAGFEIRLQDMKKMQSFKDSVYYKYIDQSVNAKTMKDINRNIFEWLDLTKRSGVLILILAFVVAVLNMITALIILIIDRTNMIGILKALGASSNQVSKIFLIQAAYIIIIGLLAGNFLGLSICTLQYFTGFIKLNQENYYLKEAPVYFNILGIVLINIGTLVICTLILLLPTRLISRISPMKAIRFD